MYMLCYFSVIKAEIAIMHRGPPEEQDLLINDPRHLTNIFTRKITKWSSSGEKITVFVKPLNSIEHKMFVINWLGITNYRYKKLLQQNTFSGYASKVKIIQSDEHMILVISSTPNSIGYTNDIMVLNDDSNITIININ